MTQNILVCKNYQVSDHSKWHRNRSLETGLEHSYLQMQELMLESAQRNLLDLDEVVVHTGECETIRDVFREHFLEIYRLWQTGVNILYADLDVLFTKPVKYFGEFDHFMMFNYTQPRRCTDTYYNIRFYNYFNCGIRYYPANMNPDIWQLGLDMVEHWNTSRWDTEQVIYNAMLWHQNLPLTQVLKPELNYQMFFDPRVTTHSQYNIYFNGDLKYTDAQAIHFHSSRNAELKTDIMQHVLSQCSGV